MGTRKEIEKLMQETSEKLYTLGYLDGVNNTAREFQPEIKKSYKEGLKDAWECARKIACMDWENDTKLFGCENPFEIYSASEAIAKIKEYEESQKSCKNCNTACVLVNTSAIPCSNWTPKHLKEGNHV